MYALAFSTTERSAGPVEREVTESHIEQELQPVLQFDEQPVTNGVLDFVEPEVAQDVGVVRQTLWRWRQDKKIPPGHRYRDRQILYSQEELNEIREFAHKLEPLSADDDPNQKKLFETR